MSAGTLVISNQSGSGTGTGAVTVNGDAFLAPAAGTKQPANLTTQSALTFNSRATYTYTYTYTFKAKGNKAQTDQVIANGVTLQSGASFNFSGQAQGRLRAGLRFTVIKNTSASAISGTFSNLPDGTLANLNANYSACFTHDERSRALEKKCFDFARRPSEHRHQITKSL